MKTIKEFILNGLSKSELKQICENLGENNSKKSISDLKKILIKYPQKTLKKQRQIIKIK